jgi:molybdenum-dependent DNA-binding transcriptional regulator ModE
VVPGSIPGATRFSEYKFVWNEVHSALVRINEELLERKTGGSGLENRD